MLQHDGLHPVDCVYMDRPGDTVHLQVPVGEYATRELLKFVYRISALFVLVFFVTTSHAHLHCRYAPTMQSNSCQGNNKLQRGHAEC